MALDRDLIESESRFLMGGVSEEILPSATIQIIIERNIRKYGDEEGDYCNVLYHTVIDSLRYLIREQIVEGASEGVSGAVTKRREKETDTEIEIGYGSSSDGSPLYTWDDLLDDFLQHPEYVCDSLVDTKKKQGSVIIGGSDINGYDESFETRKRQQQSSYFYRGTGRSPWRGGRS